MSSAKLKTDEEFAALIPPLTKDEYSHLEQSIVTDINTIGGHKMNESALNTNIIDDDSNKDENDGEEQSLRRL